MKNRRNVRIASAMFAVAAVFFAIGLVAEAVRK